MQHYGECELISYRAGLAAQGWVLNAYEWQVVLIEDHRKMCVCSERLVNQKMGVSLQAWDLMFQNFVNFCVDNELGRSTSRGTFAVKRPKMKQKPKSDALEGEVIRVDFRMRRRL